MRILSENPGKIVGIVLDNCSVYFSKEACKLWEDEKIYVLPLPTYTPFLNPREKMWLNMRRHVCHNHPY
ncbi:transposase [Candidatus Sumerlaeota bacterium]|nr:transposase [Candidatus Sumerlaeota bacterium]